ncbi:MAG TPA: DUF930 domain-containing protein [Hyphomicrobium sp.]|nr:DUF930 domain-containing protein [Hyphomicrobium sp.]
MRITTVSLAVLAAISATAPLIPARADALQESLQKLPPEERVRQVCIMKGLDRMRSDKRLPGADRMKSSILVPAQLKGEILTAKGGAVRSKHHWFEISFTCEVTKDLMKATTFNYEIGAEIPADKWEDLGLW